MQINHVRIIQIWPVIMGNLMLEAYFEVFNLMLVEGIL